MGGSSLKIVKNGLCCTQIVKVPGKRKCQFFQQDWSSINNLHVIVNPFFKLCNVNNPSKTLSICNNLGKYIILMMNSILGGFLTLLIICVFRHIKIEELFPSSLNPKARVKFIVELSSQS